MNIKDYTIPYTAEEDPEVSYYIDRSWFAGGASRRTSKWMTRRYSELPYDCKKIVDDIVTSSHLESFKHWDTNFRRKYYTKAVFMAYELGKERNANTFAKIRSWLCGLLNRETVG